MKALTIIVPFLALTIQSASSAELSNQTKELLKTMAFTVTDFHELDRALEREKTNPQYSFTKVSQGEICFELGKKDSDLVALWRVSRILEKSLVIPYAAMNSFRDSLRDTSEGYCNEGKYSFTPKIDKETAVRNIVEIKSKALILQDVITSALNR